MSDVDDGLREVRLLQFPLDVHQRATEAFEGLRREFVLVALRAPGSADVPDRLLQLVDALADEYQGLDVDAERRRDKARSRGDTLVDELVYRVPPGTADAVVALSGLLDEADEFCRRGDVLLSLASSPEAVAFRRWHLGEFTAQLRGLAPLPWPEADLDALVREPRLRGL